MVVVRALPERRRQPHRRHRQRNSHSGGPPSDDPRHFERRDPQLLGSQPARQARPDSVARRPRNGSRRIGPGAIAASARSSAACSMPTWRSGWWRNRRSKFKRGCEHQLQPAVEPADPTKQRGQQVFLNSACVLCHAIQRHDGGGQVGPDLTHFGSRMTHRRRHTAQHQRQSRRLDRRSAKHQAGQPHGHRAAAAGGHAAADRLSGEPEMSTLARRLPQAAADRARSRTASARGVQAAGFSDGSPSPLIRQSASATS